MYPRECSHSFIYTRALRVERTCARTHAPGLSAEWIAKMTNRRSADLLLVIDRLFIQMNADYRGGLFNARARETS